MQAVQMEDAQEEQQKLEKAVFREAKDKAQVAQDLAAAEARVRAAHAELDEQRAAKVLSETAATRCY